MFRVALHVLHLLIRLLVAVDASLVEWVFVDLVGEMTGRNAWKAHRDAYTSVVGEGYVACGWDGMVGMLEASWDGELLGPLSLKLETHAHGFAGCNGRNGRARGRWF